MYAEQYMRLLEEFTLITIFPSSEKPVFEECQETFTSHIRKESVLINGDMKTDYTLLLAATVAVKTNFAAFLLSICMDQEFDVLREKFRKLRRLEQEHLDKFMEFVANETTDEFKSLKKGFEQRNAENN